MLPVEEEAEMPAIWAAMPWPLCARILLMDGGTIFTSSVWLLESLVCERRSVEFTLPTLPKVEYCPGMNMECGRSSPLCPLAVYKREVRKSNQINKCSK